MVSLWAGHRRELQLSLDHNFLAPFTNNKLTQHSVTWHAVLINALNHICLVPQSV